MRYPAAVFPERTLIVPSMFCAPAGYYAEVACYGSSYVDTARRFDKRFKAAHRTEIADVHGPLRLTVPVAKPESSSVARWCDIIVSAHGAWPEVHRVALESAYGRTPYFEFYADRFLPLLSDAPRPVTELNSAFDREIRQILLLPQPLGELPDNALTDSYSGGEFPIREYWQVRSDRLGFLPGLSVLDMIFNMGPESALILRDMIAGRFGGFGINH